MRHVACDLLTHPLFPGAELHLLHEGDAVTGVEFWNCTAPEMRRHLLHLVSLMDLAPTIPVRWCTGVPPCSHSERHATA